MGIAVSTAGMSVGYCVEANAGTRPTTGYTIIPDIKEIPDFNPEPAQLDTTTLSNTEYKSYIAGLKDLSGAQGFTANMTEALQTAWANLVSTYNTAKAEGKAVWFEIKHPDFSKSVFFTGEPSALGLPGASTDAVWEGSVYITVTNEPIWETKTSTSISD